MCKFSLWVPDIEYAVMRIAYMPVSLVFMSLVSIANSETVLEYSCATYHTVMSRRLIQALSITAASVSYIVLPGILIYWYLDLIFVFKPVCQCFLLCPPSAFGCGMSCEVLVCTVV